MPVRAQQGFLTRLPLFLTLWGIASASMYMPAAVALAHDNHPASQSFFYAGTLGLICVSLIAIALGGRQSQYGALGQLFSLLGTFAVLPLFLAVPLHDTMRTTSFFNAYFDMVSAITTTGANLFTDPSRLEPSLHFWRAQVGWLGGLLMWVAASAILAPLSLGGFEITARGEPGRGGRSGTVGLTRLGSESRLWAITRTLAPLYAGLTAVVWVLLLIAGELPLVAVSHAMSVMATSGISPVGGLSGSTSGLTGEIILFLFMFFALSRLTFSNDTVSLGDGRLDRDPEFRTGLLLVVSIPLLLFARHWLASFEMSDTFAESISDMELALRSLWGALFTVMSFLTTTGFESGDWEEVRYWSGLGTPGLILMGMSLIGGGVATTAGGVKLLRVYALYLNGLRDMERLVHPSSVSSIGGHNRRIQRGGAFVAWVSFMLFALSLALVSVTLAALGSSFDHALVMSVATLSTTGPLIDIAAETPIRLIELGTAAKAVLCAAMVLGRLETLAIVALLTPDLWRR